MEFLSITDSKLKIILSDKELSEYELIPLINGKDSHAARRGFWQVLERGKSECGFDPAGDKVLIQFYPMKGGGCEIFVTKLGVLSATSAKLVTRSEHVTTLSRRMEFYAFAHLSDLINAASAVMLSTSGDTVSDVYISEDGGYFLSIIEYGKGDEECELPVLTEFARRLSPDAALYVTEHCDRIVSGDAVRFFAAMRTQ